MSSSAAPRARAAAPRPRAAGAPSGGGGSLLQRPSSSPLAALRNAELVAWSRGLTAAVGAAACGVAGLTGWRGLAAYLALHALCGLALLLRMGGRPARFLGDGGAAAAAAASALASGGAAPPGAAAAAAAEGPAAWAPLASLVFIASGAIDNAVMFVLVWTGVFSAVHFFAS
jgi:hypothetical protein